VGVRRINNFSPKYKVDSAKEIKERKQGAFHKEWVPYIEE